MLLRPLRSEDRAPLAKLLVDTDAFTQEEVDVALELIDLGIGKGDASGYLFVVAEIDGRVVGYTCFGNTPLTDGVYDLYWIAVDKTQQGAGVGKQLLRAAEQRVREHNGRMLLIETAGKPAYAATRAFYDRAGYEVIARIPDFYRVGDDKLVYMRRV